jgi:hypothetical protein
MKYQLHDLLEYQLEYLRAFKSDITLLELI